LAATIADLFPNQRARENRSAAEQTAGLAIRQCWLVGWLFWLRRWLGSKAASRQREFVSVHHSRRRLPLGCFASRQRRLLAKGTLNISWANVFLEGGIREI
jgi:hypothetical protein